MDSLYLALAAAEAEKFVGATAPNPPVGACVVRDGRVLAVGAHERAGHEHAEIMALRRALELMGIERAQTARSCVKDALRGATLYVTLEPCNHFGKTPPCTRAIRDAGIQTVVFAARDPNPQAAGGETALREAGIATRAAVSGPCEALIAPFRKRIRTGRPWVVHKLAYRTTGDGTLTMIPESGRKTFTSEACLKIAHEERRRSDAIVTGIGTVLFDEPSFTVRRVPDFANRRRSLAIVSAASRAAPRDWLERQRGLGFEISTHPSVGDALDALGRAGALRVLVEAGPRLSEVVERESLWDERLVFFSAGSAGEDSMVRELRCSPES